jgi:polygalacturonase
MPTNRKHRRHRQRNARRLGDLGNVVEVYGRAPRGLGDQCAPSGRLLLEHGDKGTPVEQRIFGDGHLLRPNFIQPYRCQNILIEGVTITNAPMWIINPVLSTNVTVRGVTVTSHGPNNDGCNPDSSRDVLIENCLFDTGDDCIAIKSGKDADGRRVNVPSENIIIRNCTMKDGHGGVVLGSETSGGVRNVFAEDCVMDSPISTALCASRPTPNAAARLRTSSSATSQSAAWRTRS